MIKTKDQKQSMVRGLKKTAIKAQDVAVDVTVYIIPHVARLCRRRTCSCSIVQFHLVTRSIK